MIERLIARGVAYVAEDHVLFSPSAMDALARRAALRLARPPLARRDAGRRAGRSRALQARSDGFRAVEAVEAEGAELAEPGRDRRARAPRLAHRVLGHVDGEAARAVRRRPLLRRPEPQRVRHPRRRHRSRLSPPRERDRAVLLRLRLAAHGQCLDAQRLPAGRRREDVEEPRQLRHHPRAAGHAGTFGGRTWPGEVLRLAMLRTHYRQPIDWTVRGARGEREETLDRLVRRRSATSQPARDGRRRRRSKRCATISIRRGDRPSCTSLQAAMPRRSSPPGSLEPLPDATPSLLEAQRQSARPVCEQTRTERIVVGARAKRRSTPTDIDAKRSISDERAKPRARRRTGPKSDRLRDRARRRSASRSRTTRTARRPGSSKR